LITNGLGLTPLVKITIPGRPRVLKNGKRIFNSRGSKRRKVVLPSSQYAQWEANAMVACLRLKSGPAIDFPCRVSMKFYFENRQAEADVSNLIEGPADVLQKVRIIDNDRLIMHVEAEKFFGSASPRAEIEIFRYVEPKRADK